MTLYPTGASARDRFVVDLRPPRPAHDPWRTHGVIIEDEAAADGSLARVATVFLTGRECPWRCLMCDLWQFTIEDDAPPQALAVQAADARRKIDGDGDVTQVKLYNAGSFFDPRAVPESEYDAIAASTAGLERVIVESHPSLVGGRTERWIGAMARHADKLGAEPLLEVAMGLETAHPVALERLNKRMTLDDFARAAERLAVMGVALRVFLLVPPPFIAPGEHDTWLLRSIDFAWECGASVVSMVPTRLGNGALDAIAAEGKFVSPTIDDLERSFDIALLRPRPPGARIFADIWDLDRFATCAHCLPDRRARLASMNLLQSIALPARCPHCSPVFSS